MRQKKLLKNYTNTVSTQYSMPVRCFFPY